MNALNRLFTRTALFASANTEILSARALQSRPLAVSQTNRHCHSLAAGCNAEIDPPPPQQNSKEVHGTAAAHGCRSAPKRWRLYDRVYAYICAELSSKYAYTIQPYKETLFKDLLPTNCPVELLEVGVGPGTNFHFYENRIPDAHIVGLDPNPEMKSYFEKMAAEHQFRGAEFVEAYGDQMPFPDKSFDCVVATHVLCSVPDVAKILSEICRVLKPQGRFLFFEHVIGPPGSAVRVVQRILDPIQRGIEGCHLTRDTLAAIRSSPFSSVHAQELILPKVFLAGPHISGFALI